MDCVPNDAEVGARARLRTEPLSSVILILDRHLSWHFVKECRRASCHFVNSAPSWDCSGISADGAPQGEHGQPIPQGVRETSAAQSPGCALSRVFSHAEPLAQPPCNSPRLLRGGAVSRLSLPLSLSNSRSTFNGPKACREPAMKPTAGLSRLDTNSAGLTLPIPSTTFRALPTSKRSAIAIKSYFAHRETSRPDLAFRVGAGRATARAGEKFTFIP